jgi:hypothetical protein
LHVLYEARARRLEAKARVAADTTGAEPDIDQQRSYVALRLEALSIERSEVLNLRREGRITAAVLRALERGFDLEESRLNSR